MCKTWKFCEKIIFSNCILITTFITSYSVKMIVKVQQFTFTSGANPAMLIYSKDKKTIFFDADLTEEVKQKMNGRMKAYFDSELENKTVRLLNEVPAQNW